MHRLFKTFLITLIVSLVTFGVMAWAKTSATGYIITGYDLQTQIAIGFIPIITALVSTGYQHQFKTSNIVAMVSSGVGTFINLSVVPNLTWVVMVPIVILLWSGNTSDAAWSLVITVALIVGLIGFALTVFGAAMVSYVIDRITH